MIVPVNANTQDFRFGQQAFGELERCFWETRMHCSEEGLGVVWPLTYPTGGAMRFGVSPAGAEPGRPSCPDQYTVRYTSAMPTEVDR
jgi:hypothetical protein